MYANYHTHTTRCQHAVGSDREYVEAAIEGGFKILGFSDHCPWPYPDGFVSGIRMTLAQMDDYFPSLEALKKEYEKDITIYIGFEAEYDPALNDTQEAFFKLYPIDYMILGQHFLEPEATATFTGTPTEDEAVLKRYVDLSIEGLRTGRYDYMAHPDLINYTGPDEIYRKHMLRLCKELKDLNLPVEINILGLWSGRNYPSRRFLKIVQEVGNHAILGVDAHDPAQLKNKDAIRQAEALCEEFAIPVTTELNLV